MSPFNCVGYSVGQPEKFPDIGINDAYIITLKQERHMCAIVTVYQQIEWLSIEWSGCMFSKVIDHIVPLVARMSFNFMERDVKVLRRYGFSYTSQYVFGFSANPESCRYVFVDYLVAQVYR